MAEKPDLSPSSVLTFTRFTILEAKETYPYVIPSFPVVTVNLRHVKYQVLDKGGDIDVFMRECPAMHRTFPAIAQVGIGYKFAFYVEVKTFILCYGGHIATYCPLLLQESEFGLCIDVPGANLPMGKVFVIWKFSWCDQSDESDESREYDSVTTQSEGISKESEREEEDEVNITHSYI